MKQRSIFFTIFLLLWMQNSVGQVKLSGTCSIKGIVSDSMYKKPLPFVTVLLFKKDTEVPNAIQLTKDDGTYSFDSLPGNNYIIKLSYSGYNTQSVNTILLSETNRSFFATTFLSANSKELANVTVSGGIKKRKIEMVQGGYVYNAEISKNINNNLKDLLSKVPGVFLDRSGIKIQGNTTVTVIIDGRTVQMEGAELFEYLSAQSAQNIATVTVLTSPSAKNEAQGTGGIIEIKTKVPKTKGVISRINTGVSSHDKYNVGIISSYNSKKFSSSINARYSHTNMYSYNTVNIENKFLKDISAPYYIAQSDSLRNSPGNNIFINLGSALTLPHNSNIAANVQYNINDGRPAPHITHTDYNNKDNARLYSFLNDSRTSQKGFNQQYYLVYTKKFAKPGRAISADFNLFSGRRPSDALNNTLSFNSLDVLTGDEMLQVNSNSKTNIVTSNLDYGTPLDSVSSFYTGFRFNSVVKTMDFVTQPFSVANSYYLKFNETINAAYFIYKRNIKNYALNLGLRLENTFNRVQLNKSNMDSLYKRSYFDFFPNISLYKTITEKKSLYFSYSRRINRPKFRSYASIIDITNPLSKTVGNPYINPVYLNSFDLTYNKQWGEENFLSIGGSAKLINNAFDNFSLYDSVHNQMVDSIVNYKGGIIYSINGTISTQLTSYLSMSNSLTLRYVKINNNLNNNFKLNTNTALTFFYNASLIGSIGKTITVQVDGIYSSKQIGIQSKSAAVAYMNFSISKSFKKQHIDLSADVMDVFNSNRSLGTITADALSAIIYNKEETRIFSLGLSWRFGKSYKTNAKKATPKIDSRTEDK
jgi:Outer membrane protein beta-barrel family/CarboxypepD_reg-like domain